MMHIHRRDEHDEGERKKNEKEEKRNLITEREKRERENERNRVCLILRFHLTLDYDDVTDINS